MSFEAQMPGKKKKSVEVPEDALLFFASVHNITRPISGGFRLTIDLPDTEDAAAGALLMLAKQPILFKITMEAQKSETY